MMYLRIYREDTQQPLIAILLFAARCKIALHVIELFYIYTNTKKHTGCYLSFAFSLQPWFSCELSGKVSSRA